MSEQGARSRRACRSTLDPPRMATNGRVGLAPAPPSSTSTSRCSSRPARRRHAAGRTDDRRRGPGATPRTRRSRRRRMPSTSFGARRRGRWPPRPGRSAGSRAARRRGPARRAGPAPAPPSTSGRGVPFGPAEVGAGGDLAPPGRAATRSSAARRGCGGRRRSSPSRTSGTLKSARSRTRLPVDASGEVLQRRDAAGRRPAALPSLGADDRDRGRRGGWSSPTRCRTSRCTFTRLAHAHGDGGVEGARCAASRRCRSTRSAPSL